VPAEKSFSLDDSCSAFVLELNVSSGDVLERNHERYRNMIAHEAL
jgi:hypothetical protein